MHDSFKSTSVNMNVRLLAEEPYIIQDIGEPVLGLLLSALLHWQCSRVWKQGTQAPNLLSAEESSGFLV